MKARIEPRCRSVFALIFLGAFLGLSCAESVRDAARTATPAAVRGSLEGLHDPQSRQLLAEFLRDPEIREASAELARSIADGALAGLTDLEGDRKMQAATDVFVDRFGAAVAKSLHSQIGPELSAIVVRSVNDSLQAAFSPDNQKLARQFASGLAPAPQRGGDAGNPADKTDPQRDTPAERFARSLARSAALGVQDAVHQSVQKEDVGNKQSGDILAFAGKSADHGVRLLWVLGVSAGVFALVAIGAILWALSRTRRYRLESSAHEQAALLIARAIKAAEGAPWAAELKEHLKQAMRDDEGAEHLRRLLRRHSDVRLTGSRAGSVKPPRAAE
ncbi:MAG TPA: hypothetical protein VGI10_16150 [Polyangiaceae bacterium]|jgi:hypothetical protein